jgi:uncharacterized protein YhaN
MRFHRLNIPAFGPFTDLQLSFPATGSDLHVIYGENEAGKSSLLRAIRDLLFGIAGQCSDNFLHDYKNLRLLGEIENRAGDRLIFQRRKGTKNTLLDGTGNPLADTALLPFLGGVSQSYFSTMFGLGSSELRDGAQQLLKGEGEIGSALFSASLGGTPVQHVLDALIAESEQLFKGRATANVSIRPSVGRYKDLLKQSRDSVVNAETWDALIKALNESELLKNSLGNEIAGCERALTWIQRCEDALPSIGRLNEEMRSLEELPAVPELASDFVSRARAARDKARETSAKVQTLTTWIVRWEDQLSHCMRSPEIMAQEDALDALHQQLGTYRARQEDLTSLQTKLAGIEPTLLAGMADLQIQGELESLEALRLGSASRMSCEEAAKELSLALRLSNESLKKAEELKLAIEEQRQELQSLAETDLQKLREALSLAEGATEADKTLEASQMALKSLERKAANARALIPDVPQDLDVAIRLSVPTQNKIRIFRERFANLKIDLQAATKRIRDETETVAKLQCEIDRLARRGELPTEESLSKAREHRDHGWELVLADWKGAGATERFDALLPLEEAFPRAVTRADEIADQLRREADAVAQAEEKRIQIQAAQRKIDAETAVHAGLEVATRACQVEWEEAWAGSGIQPRSPQEMEEWRENWVRLGDEVGKLRDVEAEVANKSKRVENARNVLATALSESGDKSFSVLFNTAKTSVQEGEETNGRRKAITEQMTKRSKELESLTRESTLLDNDLDVARGIWEIQRKAVGLPENISAESGLSLLRERKELLTKFDLWRQRSGEAGEVQEAVLKYEEEVQAMADALKVEADGTLAQESALWKALGKAREAQTNHDQITIQIRNGKDELNEAKLAETQALGSLAEHLRLASLTNENELEPLIATLEKHAEIQGRLKNLRETLGGLARGASVDDFVASVQKENTEELPRRRAELDASLVAKRAELQGVLSALLELNRQKKELEQAGDAAADFRQQAESAAATVKQDAPRFIRLRLAAHFLRTQIERFREENQGPLLEKSGQFFSAMTRGAFSGLAAEFTDQDVPVMIGRRPDGSNVHVEGMSEGARDQLYLALRLAALDRHLEEHEPMPLILDDLLITFDNERAKAILSQLAELSKRTQILLFTHHAHLVELVRQTLGDQGCNLHRLVGPPIPAA